MLQRIGEGVAYGVFWVFGFSVGIVLFFAGTPLWGIPREAGLLVDKLCGIDPDEPEQAAEGEKVSS